MALPLRTGRCAMKLGAGQPRKYLILCNFSPGASARVGGVQQRCNVTFFRGGWQKIVAQIRGVFRKTITNTPPGGQNLAQNGVFTPRVCLHSGSTGSNFRSFGYFLRSFLLLIEIYPLVPSPPSVRLGFSRYTPDPCPVDAANPSRRRIERSMTNAIFMTTSGPLEVETRVKRVSC